MKFKSRFLLSFSKPRRKRQTQGGCCHVGDNGLWLVRQETGWRSLSATDCMFDQEQWFSDRVVLPCREQLAKSGDTCGCRDWGDAPGIERVEVRDAVQHPTTHSTAQTLPQPLLPKTHLAANALGVHVVNPRLTGSPFSLGLGFPVCKMAVEGSCGRMRLELP